MTETEIRKRLLQGEDSVTQFKRSSIIFTFATKEIPYRGIGSGIKRALELYPNIEFVNDVDANEFVAIIRCESMLDNAGGVNTPRQGVNTPEWGVNTPREISNTPPNTANTPCDGDLLALIGRYPGKRIPFFVDLTKRTMKSIEHEIATLKATGQIEFRGSPKTGGYYLKDDGRLSLTYPHMPNHPAQSYKAVRKKEEI